MEGPNQFLDSLIDAKEEDLSAIRERNFARIVDLAFEHHPFYKKAFAERGLKRADIKSLADLPRLPVTMKQDFVGAPEAFRLQLPEGPIEERVMWDVMYTTGSTSGMPSPFYSTTSDYYGILLAARRMLEIRQVRPTDIIANINPMTVYPSGAYNRTLHAAGTIGIPIVSAMPGNPSPYFKLGRRLDQVVELIERTRATILWGVPSYVRKVVMRALALKADFSSVRITFLAGEATSEALRQDILSALETMGAKSPWASVSYGHTETQTGMVECQAGSGYHNAAPESFFWEVVDPVTHAPLPDGTPGLVLLTHLDRRGTVLFRYALGDIAAMESGRCPHCGALCERFTTVPRRADSRLKIKGMLVDMNELAIMLDGEATAKDYQIVIDHEDPADPGSMDVLKVLIVPGQGAAETVRARVMAEVKRTTGVTPIVEIVEPAAIRTADHANKERSLVDRRRK